MILFSEEFQKDYLLQRTATLFSIISALLVSIVMLKQLLNK